MLTVPVGTWSPICSSDIATNLPFSSFTLATDGKQPPDVDDDDDGTETNSIACFY